MSKSGDIISREWVIHNVLSMVDPETRIYAKQRLDDAPPVEPKRPKGITNAEKYKEVFGFEHPDCPTWHCPSCPVFKECSEHHFSEIVHKWWNSEYKESEDGAE